MCWISLLRFAQVFSEEHEKSYTYPIRFGVRVWGGEVLEIGLDYV